MPTPGYNPYSNGLLEGNNFFPGSPPPSYNPFGTALSGVFGDGAPLAAMFLQPLLSRFATNGGLIPTQFQPNMNLLSHMRGQQFMTEQFQVMQRQEGADQLQLQNSMAGLYRMLNGGRQLNGEDWNMVRSASPMVDQALLFTAGANPGLYDAFFGPAGSNRNFARGLHNAGRYMRDPTTGRFGLEVDTVNSLTSSLNQSLYPGDTAHQMYGVTRSEAGILMEQGALRGFFAGGRNPAEMKPQMESTIKDMAGAVSAMKDLFGDAGQPNAPIQQLITALDGLTQGGMGSMGLARVQNIVRQVSAGARMSGLGMEGSIALGNMMAQRLRSDGADPRLAAALLPYEQGFAMAARDSGMFRSDWQDVSRPDASQLASYHAQMLAASASSPMANDLAVLDRLAAEGGRGSAAHTLMEGFRNGNQSVTLPDGRSISLDAFRRNPDDVLGSLGVGADRVGVMRSQFHTNRDTITRNSWIAATVQGNQLNELLDREALVGAAQAASISGLGTAEQQEALARSFTEGLRHLTDSGNADDVGLLQDPTSWQGDRVRRARFTQVMRDRAYTALGGEDQYRALGLAPGSEAEFQYFSRMLTQGNETSRGRLFTVANDHAAGVRQGPANAAIQVEATVSQLLSGYNRTGPLARVMGILSGGATSNVPLDLDAMSRMMFGENVPPLSAGARGAMESIRGILSTANGLGSQTSRQAYIDQHQGELARLMRDLNVHLPGGYDSETGGRIIDAAGGLASTLVRNPSAGAAATSLFTAGDRIGHNLFNWLNNPDPAIAGDKGGRRSGGKMANNRPDQVVVVGGSVSLNLANSTLNFAPPGGVASTPNGKTSL